MMGKTHVSVGIASAVLVTQPVTLEGWILALVGGSIGGIVSDVEVRSNPKFRDALHARLIVLAIVLVAVLTDVFVGGPISRTVADPARQPFAMVGGVILIILLIIGRFQGHHRAFTHSILALLLLSVGVALVIPSLAIPFAVGFCSHIILDLMNKQRVQVFYPFKFGKFCLGWCYANGVVNVVFLVLGLLGIVVWLVFSVSQVGPG